jgi:hypothetical protein
MKRSLLALLSGASLPALLVLAGCVGPFARVEVPPVSPQEIIIMVKGGETTANIIARIQASKTVYNLTASQFVQLSKEGIPDAVLDYMQRTHISEIAREARRDAYNDLWFTTRGWYGHPWYAQPQIVYVPARPPRPKDP